MGVRARKALPITQWRRSADAIRLSLFGIMLVNVSAIHMYMGPARLLRPGMLLLLIALSVALLRPGAVRWANLKQAGPSRAVFALLVLACLSGVFGLSPGGSLRYILDVYGRNLLVFFLTVAAIRSVRDLALLQWSFVAAVAAVVVLAQTVLELNVTREGLGRLDGGHGIYDANDLGMILLMALPITLQFFFNSRRLGKLVAAGTLIGIPVTIALTGSRGALVGLVVVGLALLVKLDRVSVPKRVVVLAVTLAGLIVGAPDGYWKQMSTLLNPTEDYNYSVEYGRKGIALRGLGYMMRYPVFGVGVANFPRAEGTISPIAQARLAAGLSVEWIAPHNTYVQVGAEMGTPALLLWLWLIYAGTIGLLKLRRRLPERWDYESPERRFLRESCLFLPLSFLAFAVTSLFLSHAYTGVFYIIVAYLAGVHVLARRELRKDQIATAAPAPTPLVFEHGQDPLAAIRAAVAGPARSARSRP